MKVADAIGAQLDWLVAKCQGYVEQSVYGTPELRDGAVYLYYCDATLSSCYSPSTDPAQGYPIIEREGIDVFTEKKAPESWVASTARYQNGGRLVGWRIHQYGPTPLIAAMRAYVVSKLGDEADVPEELCT